MPDVFTKAKRSEVMSRIRGKGNKDTELALAKLLRLHRITGWRRQILVKIYQPLVAPKSDGGGSARVYQLKVRPDFVFQKSRTAVFVDGCFWHGCPRHATKPKNNAAFWRKKLTSNKTRDLLVNRTLRKSGWTVLRIWECDLARKRQPRLLRRLQKALGR